MLKIKGVGLLLCLLRAMQAVQGLADGAAWQGDNEWAVTLNYADGVSRNGTIFVDRDGSVTLPPTPVRRGYTFAGWVGESGALVEGEYCPAQNVTLTAQWAVGQCAVTLIDGATGEELGQTQVEYGSAMPEVAAPQKEGYAFRYWSLSPEGERLSTDGFAVKNDMKLYAVWLEESQKEYRVVFKGSAACADFAQDLELYVVEGGSVKKSSAPKNLEREGYKFEGWTQEEPADGVEWTIDTFPAK